MGYRLTIDERELHIWINENDKDYIYAETSIIRYINKFNKLGWEKVKEQYYDDGTIESVTYKVPLYAISFRKPVKVKKEMTEEQKEAARERMKMMVERRKSKKQNVV